MNTETLIYKLLARALLDIRIACVEGRSDVAFELADLFHNVPHQMERIRRERQDHQEIFDWLEMRCKQEGMSGWLKNAISDCSQQS